MTGPADAAAGRPDRAIAGPELARDEVHIWTARMSAVDPRATEWLPAHELRRAGSIASPRARHTFLAARVVLRRILAGYLGCEPQWVALVATPGEKPTLADDACHGALSFNVSHGGDLAVVAVARGREVGVDVEEVAAARTMDLCLLAERELAAHELTVVRACRGVARQRAFLRYWTRREALLKAAGTGLVSDGPPSGVATSSQTSHSQALQWTSCPLPLGAGHVGTVAARGHGWRLRCLPV